MENTRTVNSIRNSFVAILMYVINLVLQFISRKVFIDYLGADVLGLNTTIVSILQFLNIAELGIGTAISCTLYKPISNGDNLQICDIISLQGHLYKRIACFILVCGLVVIGLIPVIFSKTVLPLWYAYSTFIVLLFSSLLTYFVTYKQIILSASQQEYKILLSYKLWQLVKIVAQVAAIVYFKNGYLWWLFIEALFAIISCISVNSVVYNTFPFLKNSPYSFKQLQEKYPAVKTKVFQLFFHKIASFALSQLSPIILYAYASLEMVAKYGNYMLVTTGVTSMLAAIFNGLNAGVGNLVAENDIKRILTVFRELFSSRFWIVSSCTICLFYLCNSFIGLWVGYTFILDTKIVLLMTIIFHLTSMRTIVDSYIQAYGLFHDIGAPILEAFLNIGLSILLGRFFGLSGILLGIIISMIVVVFIWKPILLFYKGFKYSIRIYIDLYLKHIVVFGVCVTIVSRLVQFHNWNHCVDAFDFLCKSIMLFITSMTIIGTGLYITESGMRDFIKRIIHIVKYTVKW